MANGTITVDCNKKTAQAVFKFVKKFHKICEKILTKFVKKFSIII